MRCPACGARNSPRAEWCSQCYATLGDAPEPEPSAPPAAGASTGPVASDDATDDVESPGDVEGTATGGPPPTRDEDPSTDDRGFRQGEDGLEWGCQVCGTWNDIDAVVCATCGEPFTRTLAGDGDDGITPRDPSTVLVASVALPGAGHIALGRTGDGVVRALTYLLWVGGALVLLRGATPLLPVVPLMIGALALLAVSVRDAVHLAEGGRDQLLTPRVFLWLVVGVIGALVAAFVPGILQVVEGTP